LHLRFLRLRVGPASRTSAVGMALVSQLAPAAVEVRRKRVLHLVGSRQDEFYHDLSVLYARACNDCEELDRERFEFMFAVVHIDGAWSFPQGLDEKSVAEAKRMPITAAIAHIGRLAPDVMVPHMFCVEGMTRVRSLFGLLDIPFLGNHDYTVWPSTDKATTKQLLTANGVQVPRGELLVQGQTERPSSVSVPLVVKPCNEDNSRGITLVRREEDLAAAIDYAFSFDPRVVVDEYIAGREVRAACVEEADGTLTVLPKIEYFLADIRTSAHKLATDQNGKLVSNAIKAAKKDGDRQCPADLSPALHQRIDAMVKEAHRVLKCRHYSLYDLRVDANEQPYILEAALFCSFSPLSVIPAMAQHSGREDLKHPNLFHSLLERTAAEKKSPQCAAVQKPLEPAAPKAAQPIRVLHLMGSPTSSFYFDLSVMYARTAVEFDGLDRSAFVHEYAVVFVDGTWAFPASLDGAALEASERFSLGLALARIEASAPGYDVVAPHMFCVEGMTRYRALCEMLRLEVLGCPAHTCTIANDKFLTKQICQAAGVPVPRGELLRTHPHYMDVEGTAKELLARRSAPFIVKPAREDNSIGLALVRNNSEEEVAAALAQAFQYDDHVLVEDYIAGRECRVAVLEGEDGEEGGVRLEVLPKIEYLLEDVRTSKHKLSTDASGRLLSSDANPADAILKAKKEGDRVCPAQFSPEVHERLNDLACKAHKALGCKYYSLYDVRIDEDGFPFMLEAALFCSFSPLSVVVALADKTEGDRLRPHPRVFQMLLRRAAKETRARRERRARGEAVAVTGAMKSSATPLGSEKPRAPVETASTTSGGATLKRAPSFSSLGVSDAVVGA